jgi:HicB family
MATAPAGRAKTEEDRHSGRLLLRMPPALHGELARAAEREGTSLNAYITQRLSDALAGGEEPRSPDSGASRFMRIAMIVDLVMVAIATVAAVALLIVAWP